VIGQDWADPTNQSRTSSTANLVSVELENLNMESIKSFEIPHTEKDKTIKPRW